MSDLALTSAGVADLSIVDDDLAADDGLRTAVLLSLFLDRRAEPGDLPADDSDVRGWWADELATDEGDRIGARLWQLDRSTMREDTQRRAEEMIRESLAWMLEDKVSNRIDVTVSAGADRLDYAVTIYRPVGDPASFRFAHAWDGEQLRSTDA